MDKRKYYFHSVWDIDAPIKTVWQTLTATPFSWEKWWPELHDLKFISTPVDLLGTRFSCSWRAPVGYSLITEVSITEVVDKKHVKLMTSGDPDGWVSCNITPVGNRTHVDIDWHVETSKVWMNLAYPLLKPIFVLSHHAVMKSGEIGLQKYIKNSPV